MNEPERDVEREPTSSADTKPSSSVTPAQTPPAPLVPPAPQQQPDLDRAQRVLPNREEAARWWLKLVLQPMLILAMGVLLIVALGLGQRFGWITSASSGGQPHTTASGDKSVRYICPMKCTPPQSEPGRCPVCGMELVPATAGVGNTDSKSIQIDPAARRVANIQTLPVKKTSARHTIRVIGELSYDEGTLKSISAYVDGRIESLYADYTGVLVQKGDKLALVYSPRLYSSQVELLLAQRARDTRRSSTLVDSNQNMYESARQRLIEFGMTEQQIVELERQGEANSRLHLVAPISGTVIEKLAVEGQYIKEGQAIYKLADLSTVWLMLQLFPKDAAMIRYGQKVTATVQSLPGREFTGRVAFLDPNVDPTTRTVGVRVVVPNPDGHLRIGDYAKATIDVVLGAAGELPEKIYDPDLAGKWISPRHPHVVSTQPGACPVCGIDLVPAAAFGFTDTAIENDTALVVPRDAVLMAGDNSVVYVEVKPGRFEIRRVVLGANIGDAIVIVQGVKEGEMVATRGNFLIDSQMQLAGNPSLIDPNKAQPSGAETRSPQVLAALAKLSAEDRRLAEAQRICPVTEQPLGSMGVPPKVDVKGRVVFICCEGCRDLLLADADKYLAVLDSRDEPAADSLSDEERQAIDKALATLSPEDRQLAETQRLCPVTSAPLGSMGTPKKVDLNGVPVFICCEGCRAGLLKEPEKYLRKIAAAQSASDSNLPEMDLPPLEMPELIVPDDESSGGESSGGEQQGEPTAAGGAAGEAAAVPARPGMEVRR